MFCSCPSISILPLAVGIEAGTGETTCWLDREAAKARSVGTARLAQPRRLNPSRQISLSLETSLNPKAGTDDEIAGFLYRSFYGMGWPTKVLIGSRHFAFPFPKSARILAQIVGLAGGIGCAMVARIANGLALGVALPMFGMIGRGGLA